MRQSFCHLDLFVSNLSEEKAIEKDIGLRPEKEGIAKRFDEYIEENRQEKGVDFLGKAFKFAIDRYKYDRDEFVFSMADAALGDYYPVPPRIFPHMEKIILEYINDVLGLKEDPKSSSFDLFSTEGGAAAMCYLFKSLKVNKIINPKDSIAIITPIFSPYLEMPHLKDFDLIEILLESDEHKGWQISDEEINKLKDPKIKAVYIVNPANPTAIALSDHVVKVLSDFVKTKRKDLIILTDTVYATFVDGFHSIVKEIPQNCICVYSFSKYYGVTGWRLGTIMLSKKNIIDEKIQNFSDSDKKELFERYKTVAPDPNKIPFIERLELDSRDEALAHTGGLSGPQQAIMTLFALYELLDKNRDYKKNIHEILKNRITLFYNNLGVKVPDEKGNSYYYSLMDFKEIAKEKYDEDFAKHLEKNVHSLEFLFRLGEEKYIILLP